MSIRITAAICTYNRAALLPDAIQSLLNQNLSPAAYEILIVDNSSTDETAAIIQSYVAAPKEAMVRSAFASPLGLSHARNLAVQRARGDIIAFLDDDARAEPDWLAALLDTYAAYPAAWAVGGKIVPAWEAQRPVWLTDDLVPQLSILDLDNATRPLTTTEELFGANCSFHRQAFAELGLFRTDLGRRGQQLWGSEESELQARIRLSGKVLVYTPHAVVHHKVTPERLRPDYFVRLAYKKGQTRVRLLPPNVRFSAILWSIVRGGLAVLRQWMLLGLHPSDRTRQIQCLRATAGWFGYISESATSGKKSNHSLSQPHSGPIL